MTIDTYMNQIIQKAEGNALAIGPTISMEKALQENATITICDVLSKNNPSDRKKSFFHKRPKTFSFKKMRKTFHKKTKDIIIGDVFELERYMKTFIRDSIYITKGNIYLFVKDTNYDLDLLMKRYQRFDVTCEKEKVEDGIVLKVTVFNAKNHYWKEKLYYIVDTIVDIADIIGDALVS